MAEERKVEFAGSGVIKKCPNCGAQIEAFQARCPACGFAISGVERGGTSSLQVFMDKYLSEYNKERQLDMINTFPIPNTIEDTIEFALLAVQQVKSYAQSQKENTSVMKAYNGFFIQQWQVIGKMFTGATKEITDNDFLIAWKNKLDQVCQRAKIAYPQDRTNLERLDTLVKDAEKEFGGLKKKKARTRTIIAAVVIGFIVGIYGILIPIWDKHEAKNKEIERLEKLTTEIQTDIAEGNYDDAEFKLMDFKWKYNKDESQITIWEEKNAFLRKQLESKKEGKK